MRRQMNSFESVLIVDDDPIIRTVLRGYFQGLSVDNIQDAADGAAAANLVRDFSGSFDVVVTDLSMPEQDGIQLLRSLHDEGFQGDVVIASGRDASIIETAKSLAKGHNLNLRGCISKPLTKPKLDQVFRATRTSKAPAPLNDALDAGSLSRLFTEHGIVPYFQPKVSVRTGKIVGAEALVRGEHQDFGHLGASQIVTAARSYNMMGALTDIMIRKALEQLSLWLRQGIDLQT